MNLLFWASGDARLADVEEELQSRAQTLGPIARHAAAQTIRHLVRHDLLLRLNPALGALENAASAFEYAGGKTKTTPREACGPELKALLTQRDFSAVQVRTLPAHEEKWWRLEAPSKDVLHSWLKQTLRAGCFHRSLLCLGANGWIAFAGEMADAYGEVAKERAQAMHMEMTRDQAPKHPTENRLARADWSDAGAQIFLCDAWHVIREAA